MCRLWWVLWCAETLALTGCIGLTGSQEGSKQGNPAHKESQRPSNLVVIRDPERRVSLTLRLIPPWTPDSTERPYRFPFRLVSTDPAFPISVEINALRPTTPTPAPQENSKKVPGGGKDSAEPPKEEKIGHYRGAFQSKKLDGKNVVIFEGTSDTGSWVLFLKAESERLKPQQMIPLLKELIRNISPGASISRLA